MVEKSVINELEQLIVLLVIHIVYFSQHRIHHLALRYVVPLLLYPTNPFTLFTGYPIL